MVNNKVSRTGMLTFLLVLLVSSTAWAHCTWVEAPYQVSQDEVFSVMAFYADPDDPMEERDMTELSLYVIGPDGAAQPVDMARAATYQYASMTLDQEGQWRLALEREPNRYRLQEIRDFGSSIVWVGEAGTWVNEPVGLSLEVVVVSENQRADGLVDLTLAVYYEGESVGGAEIEVFQSLAEDITLYDEVDEVETDAQGQVMVTVNPEHRYVFETDHRLPAREVSGTGTFITEVRFRSTLALANR